jgi:hypothetical protein
MLETLEFLDSHHHHHGPTVLGDDHRLGTGKINQTTEAILGLLGGERYHGMSRICVSLAILARNASGSAMAPLMARGLTPLCRHPFGSLGTWASDLQISHERRLARRGREHEV